MRYFIVSAFFIITLSIMVWMTFKHEDISAEDCEKPDKVRTEQHVQYLAQYGWDVKSTGSTCKRLLDYYPEALEPLQIAGLNLEPFNKKGKEAYVTTYTLKQKQKNGDKLSAAIYEIDGELVGGYGALENWIPGAFALDEKERLIEEGILSSSKK